MRAVSAVLDRGAGIELHPGLREQSVARTEQARCALVLAHRRSHTGKVDDAVRQQQRMVELDRDVQRFPADEVIISTHPPEKSRWLETGVVERAREEIPLPVTHVVVDLEAEAREPSASTGAPV